MFHNVTKSTKFLAAAMLLCFCIFSNNAMGQNADGYIMQISGDNIYLKLHANNVKVGDVLSVMSEGGYIKDPKTGQDVPIAPEVIGQVKVIQVTNAYSIGKAYGNTEIFQLADAMTVSKGTVLQADGYGETTVMIAPASVMLPEGVNTLVSGSNGQQGYIGDVVAAELMNELLKCKKITVIDRSVIAVQETEFNLINSGMVDQNTAIQLGKMSGARYVVQITLQKPDVEKVENNVPLGTILGGVANTMGNNTYNNNQPQIRQTQQQLQQASTYAPDIRNTNIKVKVKIYTKVVDLQTSRILFQCSGEGNAKGKPQIQLEFMQLGAANVAVNQNADFTHSVTGKAIEKAFKKIGKDLRKYFEKNL